MVGLISACLLTFQLSEERGGKVVIRSDAIKAVESFSSDPNACGPKLKWCSAIQVDAVFYHTTESVETVLGKIRSCEMLESPRGPVLVTPK